MIDWDAAQSLFKIVNKELTKTREVDVGIVVNITQPTNGGVLLFGNNRLRCFPDSRIRYALDKVSIPLHYRISYLLLLVRRICKLFLTDLFQLIYFKN